MYYEPKSICFIFLHYLYTLPDKQISDFPKLKALWRQHIKQLGQTTGFLCERKGENIE